MKFSWNSDLFGLGMKFHLPSMSDQMWRFSRCIQFSQEKMMLMAGVVIFSLMGSFVLWGPTQKNKKRLKNSTGVNGLRNMGETCFLNTLLQGIAASPLFCEWLATHQQQSTLAQALLTVTQYVNSGSCSEVPLYPRAVVSAMSDQGWTMGIGQQDSHELFFALMSCLEEETSRTSKPQHVLSEIVQENGILPQIKDKDDSCHQVETDQSNDCKPGLRFVSRTGGHINGSTLHKHKTDLPFRGQQLSQLTCTICSKSSVVQHQAFDCLSLTLPALGPCTLEQLLTAFTAPEQVHEVQCDHCTAAAGPDLPPIKATFIKQLSIGKLPKCLCFHIQRTSWLSDGQAYKRHDFVAFPEILEMDQFTYCYKQRVRKTLLNQLKASQCGDGDSSSSKVKDKFVSRHKYRLNAVIVHLGEVTSGHFVTYRRPPAVTPVLDSQNGWVCVSDDECHKSNLAEVMRARAYMLIYDKLN